MGVYIDMEMSKSYKDIRIYADGRVVSKSLHTYGEEIATAVSVPEPHGDLIDRKALMEGEGRYFISICKEGIDVEEILRANAIIPASEEGET